MKIVTNLNIFKKLMLSFLTVALICAIVGAVGWLGINQTQASLADVGGNQLPAVQGLGVVMTRINTIKAAERTMINPGITIKDRQKELAHLDSCWDHFNAGWNLYTATKKTEEEKLLADKAQEALTAWKIEHAALINLVRTVELGEVETVTVTLLARETDLLDWAMALEKAIADNAPLAKRIAPRGSDPGKWLIVNRVDSPEFADILDSFKEAFEKLHVAGNKMNSELLTGNQTSAARTFREEVLPALTSTRVKFLLAVSHAREQLEILEEARDIAFGQERKVLDEATASIETLYEMAIRQADDRRSEAASAAKWNKMLSVLAVLLGVACALAFGTFIARGISRPINKSIEALERISLGDTSAADTVSMGKAVNCSSIKNCGNQDCPSFGKTDHCWVTSGSMAVIKHCPRALKGEDCRTCELYGARTEVEELGSIVNSIGLNLADRERLAMAIADGDLTCKVDIASEHDALGQALQTMQESLLSMITQIKMAGNEIASGSMQIADSSQNLAHGASDQAGSLEQVSSAMTEMASQTKMTADNARQARELSATASTAAETGNRHMQQMVDAMTEIHAAGQSVANVIKVIDEIAFQTNMLALNAAVEAAHAGQHGKGFAVVAEEVRNLAARSAKAAKETEELIAGSVDKTKNGATIADQTAAALNDIMEGVTETAKLVNGIAEAAQEQSLGIEQVTQGLGRIDQVTQQNSASAQEGAAAAEELSSQAAQMRQLLQQFKVKHDDRETEGNSFLDMTAQAQITHNPDEVIPLDDSEFGRF